MNNQMIEREQMAMAMAGSALLPTHLRKKKVDGAWEDRDPDDIVRTCICLIEAAKAWDFEPMALAMASYDVNGKIDYEGQVYTALANLRAGLKAPLNVEYEYGMGTEEAPTSAKIFGTLRCETQPRSVEVFLVRAKKTANTENWENDPEQQLFYYGCKRWVKRHAPEIAFAIDTNLFADDVEVTIGDSAPILLTPSQEKEANAITSGPTGYVTSGKTRGYMREIDKCLNFTQLKAVRRLMDQDTTLNQEEKDQILRHGKKRYDKLAMTAPKEQEVEEAEEDLEDANNE